MQTMLCKREEQVDLFTLRRLEKILDGYIAVKVPRDVRSAVRLSYEFERNRLTLFEERPDYPRREWKRIALVQFYLEAGMWSVYAKSGGGEWFLVDSILPDPDFERQLEQVEIDQDGLFWIS